MLHCLAALYCFTVRTLRLFKANDDSNTALLYNFSFLLPRANNNILNHINFTSKFLKFQIILGILYSESRGICFVYHDWPQLILRWKVIQALERRNSSK